jgi:hypothetical protein
MILACIITFISGAAYEAGCVAWCHYSEHNDPLRAAVASLFISTCQIAGIGESVSDWRVAPLFVLGYGIGTFGAVAWKKHHTKLPSAGE